MLGKRKHATFASAFAFNPNLISTWLLNGKGSREAMELWNSPGLTQKCGN